jgi:hypothetical protein
MYVYVCMCVCVCVCVHVCMSTYKRIVHIYTYIYLCACVCVCIYTSPSQATNRGEFENGPVLARTERQKRLCTMIASSVARLLATSSSSFSYYYSHYMIASSVCIQYLRFTLELRTVAPSQANFTTRESRDSGEHLHSTVEMVDAGSGLRIVLNRTLQPPEALKLSGLTHYLGDPLVLPPSLPLPLSLSRSRAIATLLATHQQAL